MKKIFTLLVMMLLLTSFDVEAGIVNHKFKVEIGGMDSMDVTVDFDLVKNAYRFKTWVKTIGVVSWVNSMKASYESRGKIKEDKFIPVTYLETNKSGDRYKTREFIYENGVMVSRFKTRNGNKMFNDLRGNKDAVGAADFQTAYSYILNKYITEGNCNGGMAVFNGKIRFDVNFKDLGDEKLKNKKYPELSGEFRKCQVYIDGHGQKSNNFLLTLSADRPIYFWMKKSDDGKLPIVSKIYVDSTGYGSVDVNLVKYEIE